MYACPLCGKSSNRRGGSFETVGQVVAHVNGSHDADHEDVRGEDIRDDIQPIEGSESSTTDSDETDDENHSEEHKGTETAMTDGSESTETVEMTPDEMDDMIEAAAEAREQSIHEDESKEITLPCGHESFDPEQPTENDFVQGKLPVTCEVCHETYWYE